jgi:hypothetical protein
MADERKKNNFQRLMEEEYEPRFTLPQMMEIENRLKRQQNTIRTTSDMVDLYLPKVIKAFIHLLGGTDSDDSRSSPAPSDLPHMPKQGKPKAPGER